jgi:hormone-sensitive lipase
MVFGASAIWYYCLDGRAKMRAVSHICDLKLQSALDVMNLIEQPGIKHMMNLGLPYIAMNKKIYIDSIVPPITMEKLKQERVNNLLDRITP